MDGQKFLVFLFRLENKEKRSFLIEMTVFFGTPEGTRTPDLLVRSQTLYPTELLARFAVFR